MTLSAAAALLLFAPAAPAVYLSGTEKPPESEFRRELRAGLEGMKTLRTKFIQTKRLKTFRRPLVITGELCLDRAGRFAWHVFTPVRCSCVLNGTKLTQWDADSGREFTLDTSRNAALAFFAETMRDYFRGNWQKLEDACTIREEPRHNRVMVLPAPGSPVRAFVSSMTFTFSPDRKFLLKAEILEFSGDRTTLEFKDPEINRKIPPARRKAKPE